MSRLIGKGRGGLAAHIEVLHLRIETMRVARGYITCGRVLLISSKGRRKRRVIRHFV